MLFLNLVHENLEYKVAVADVCCCPSSYFGMSSSLYLIHAWHRPPVEKLPHIGTVDGHMPAPAKQLYGEYHKQRCSIKIVGLLLNNPLKLNITTVKVEAYEFPVAPCVPTQMLDWNGQRFRILLTTEVLQHAAHFAFRCFLLVSATRFDLKCFWWHHWWRRWSFWSFDTTDGETMRCIRSDHLFMRSWFWEVCSWCYARTQPPLPICIEQILGYTRWQWPGKL